VSQYKDTQKIVGVISDRAFKRNLHSIVNTYLKLKGERSFKRSREFYPAHYRVSKRKLERTA
jgi:hypothetical protein